MVDKNYVDDEIDNFIQSRLYNSDAKKRVNKQSLSLHNSNCAIHLESKVIDAIKEFNFGLGYFGNVTNADALKLWFVGNKVLKKHGDTPAMYNKYWRTQKWQGNKPDNFGYKSWKVLDTYVRDIWSIK